MTDTPRHLLVFDSGIGGLGVVNALRQAHAGKLQIDYIADNAIFPYGEQPDAALLPRVVSLVEAGAAETKPEAVIIACNTASTIALPSLRATLDIPVIGCVPPVRWAARETKSGVFCILATAATARRPYLTDLKTTFAPNAKMIVHGGRCLADLAERAFLGEPISSDALRNELATVYDAPDGAAIDTIGLGCTHYTFLKEALEAASPSHVQFLDPAEAVARQALKVLSERSQQIDRNSLALARERNVASGRMFMTAAPAEPQRLEKAVARFGYTSIEIWKTT